MKDWDPAEEPERWKADLDRWKADEAQAVFHQNAAQAAVQTAQQAVTSITAGIAALTPAAAGSRDRGPHLEAVTADLTATDAAIATGTDAIADREQARDIATARLLAGPATGVPVTLLPVSLHTSWAAETLRVRIYPDQISTGPPRPGGHRGREGRRWHLLGHPRRGARRPGLGRSGPPCRSAACGLGGIGDRSGRPGSGSS